MVSLIQAFAISLKVDLLRLLVPRADRTLVSELLPQTCGGRTTRRKGVSVDVDVVPHRTSAHPMARGFPDGSVGTGPMIRGRVALVVRLRLWTTLGLNSGSNRRPVIAFQKLSFSVQRTDYAGFTPSQ